MTKKSSVIAFALLAFAPFFNSALSAATVTGVVLDEAGVPVRGARLLLIGNDPSLPTLHRHQDRLLLVADGAGRFTYTGAKAGTYYLCLSGPDEDSYLRSCEWSGASAVRTDEATILDLRTITLQKSSPITVIIKDAQHLLPRQGGLQRLTAAPSLILGVKDSLRQFHSARLVSQDADQVTFSVPVPATLLTSLWAFSNDLIIVDADGHRVNVGTGNAITPTDSYGDGSAHIKPGTTVILTVLGRTKARN